MGMLRRGTRLAYRRSVSPEPPFRVGQRCPGAFDQSPTVTSLQGPQWLLSGNPERHLVACRRNWLQCGVPITQWDSSS
jgi:hypothetical protein